MLSVIRYGNTNFCHKKKEFSTSFYNRTYRNSRHTTSQNNNNNNMSENYVCFHLHKNLTQELVFHDYFIDYKIC